MSSKVLSFGDQQSVEPINWDFCFQADDAYTEPAAPEPAPSTVPAVQVNIEAELAHLRAEFAQRLAAAEQNAYSSGVNAGRQEATHQLAESNRQLVAAVQACAALVPRLRQQAERDVVQLAIAIARRILHREVAVDPTIVLGVTRAALESLASREVVSVRVHPALLPALTGRMQYQVLADPALAAGGVVVELANGRVDASIETQLDEIQRGFADLRENS